MLLVTSSWSLIVLLVSALVALAWVSARRFHLARRGEKALLRRRQRILRLYTHRRDGRTYHPERNPEVARLLDPDRS